MNWRITGALVAKDVTLFFRNRFFALISILGIVAYVVIYFVMPRQVDETLEIGLYAPVMPPPFLELMEAEGIIIQNMDSEVAMKEAMLAGDFFVGVVLPADTMEKIAAGQKGTIHIYFTSDFPDDLKEAYEILFTELAYLAIGRPMAVEGTEVILGPDMGGNQIPPRDRMLPLFAIFVLIIETMGLASLISEEIVGGTLQALMTTPMGVGDLFLGKGITGVGLAFIQAVAFVAVTGGLSQQPALILVTLLLGAVLVTGIAFLMASAGKDMLSVIAWGIPAMIILNIPAFGVMIPGTMSNWAKLIPSYYLVDTLHRGINFGIGWRDTWQNLLILLGFDLLFVWLGIAALRRRFR